ncbi:hypothetical protein D3C80_1087220 [compost metagenome]
MPVHQHGNQFLTRGISAVAVAVGRLQKRLNILFPNQIAQRIELIVGKMFARQQHGDRIGHRTVVLLFFNKHVKVVETVGIEQAQAREMAFETQLFWRCRQKQNTRDALRQLFNRHVLAAWGVFAPDQMVRFIDDQQIPLGIAKMLKALLATTHKVEGANHQLLGFERVLSVVLGFGITLVIEQGKTQVKAAQHFNQPLVLQGFRHHDQHTFRGTRQQLLVQNHARFDGFTQAHFIRQQYARCVTTTHVVSDVELMGNQAGALSAQAAPRHTVLLALELTRAIAQGEAVHTVNLTGEQAILWLAEHQTAIEHHLAQHNVCFIGI